MSSVVSSYYGAATALAAKPQFSGTLRSGSAKQIQGLLDQLVRPGQALEIQTGTDIGNLYVEKEGDGSYKIMTRYLSRQTQLIELKPDGSAKDRNDFYPTEVTRWLSEATRARAGLIQRVQAEMGRNGQIAGLMRPIHIKHILDQLLLTTGRHLNVDYDTPLGELYVEKNRQGNRYKIITHPGSHGSREIEFNEEGQPIKAQPAYPDSYDLYADVSRWLSATEQGTEAVNEFRERSDRERRERH